MKKNILLLGSIGLLMACSNETEIDEKQDLLDNPVQDEVTIKRAEKAQKVFQTVPSPYETASIFEEAGAAYNPELTNPVNNVSKYTLATKQALNLGVYGADLSYANIFDQTQESMFYMNCSKKMADALEISSAFTPETIERIEVNMNNRDSMMNIVNDAFWMCDAYLKENGQENLSALIIAGGWIEGLYLGTKSLDRENPNEELMKRIADQKYSLNNLMDLLSSYSDEDVKSLYNNMAELKASFDKIEEKEAEASVTEGDVPTIGGGSTLSYEQGTIFEIADITEKLRDEIIK